MRQLKSTLAVLGAVTVLVLAGNTIAMATTGHAFILGKINSANKQTTLTRTTNGPVLKLNAKQATGVPLAVRGTGKVANLNADKVDGIDSSGLRTHSLVYTKTISVPVTNFTMILPMPAGTYLFNYSAFLIGGGTGNTFCQIQRDHASTSSFVGISQFTSNLANPGLTGSGLVTKTAGDTVELVCAAANNFTTGTIPVQVVLTPTVVAGGGALRIAPGGSRLAGR